MSEPRISANTTARSTATATIEPLACAGCGGTVPLEDADEVRCPHCGAAVKIPAGHREALRQQNLDAAARTEAQRLYAKLGVEPGLFLKVFGLLFNGWFLVFGGILVVLLGGLFATWFAMVEVCSAMHMHAEVLPSRTRDLLTVPTGFALVLIGAALGVYGRRRAVSRMSLQAALAAAPPKEEGGPATCRVCGAPVFVPPGVLGVRCAHCLADNLVGLPPEYLARLRGDVASVQGSIEDAVAAQRVEAAAFHRRLAMQLGGVGVVIAAFSTIGLSKATHEDKAHFIPPSFDFFKGEPRPLLRRRVEYGAPNKLEPGYLVLGSMARCPLDASPLDFVPRDCSADGCKVRLYAALHRGERASLTLTGAASRVTVEVRRHAGFPWPKTVGDAFGPDVARLVALPGAAATFAPAWSAWHEFAFTTPAPPPKGARVCLQVGRAAPW